MRWVLSYGIVHAATGVIIQQATGLPGLPLAFLSHWALDDLNVGDWRIYHGTGGPWKWLFYAFQGFAWLALAWWLLGHPIGLLGAFAASAWDLDWVLPTKGWLHWHMFPRWLWGRWGLLVWLVVITMMVGVIWL